MSNSNDFVPPSMEDRMHEAAQFTHWPNCAVPDCPNKAFTPLSEQCFPHWRGLPFMAHDAEATPELSAMYEAERSKVMAEHPNAFYPDGRVR